MPTERSCKAHTGIRTTDRVRSLYLLGWIAEQKGDTDSARDWHRRFLEYWGEGDYDRERVDHARQFVGPS